MKINVCKSLTLGAFIVSAALEPHSWVVVLASAVWQPLLPVGGPACLYDTEHDVRIPEPEGALTSVIISINPEAASQGEILHFFVSFLFLALFSKVWRDWTAAAASTACWAPAFYPVTSPQKKLTRKCSPPRKYPSIRWEWQSSESTDLHIPHSLVRLAQPLYWNSWHFEMLHCSSDVLNYTTH